MFVKKGYSDTTPIIPNCGVFVKSARPRHIGKERNMVGQFVKHTEIEEAARQVAILYNQLEAAKMHLRRAALAEFASTGNKMVIAKANGRAAVSIQETRIFPDYKFEPGEASYNWFAAGFKGRSVINYKEFEKLATPDSKALALTIDIREHFPGVVEFNRADYEREAKINPGAPVQPESEMQVRFSADTLAKLLT